MTREVSILEVYHERGEYTEVYHERDEYTRSV